MLPKTSAEGFDSEIVVCGEGRARDVDTVRVLSVCESHCLYLAKNLQYWTAGEAAPFESTEVIVADDEKKDYRINEISETKVKCPDDASAARACAEVVEGSLSIGDLGR